METLRHVAQRIVELAYPPAPVSDAAIEKLASILIRTDLKKNAKFLNQGEVCKQIGYVQKGMIRQFYYKNKKDLTEHFACEDSIFICIESFLRQRPTHLMVEALENTVLYGILCWLWRPRIMRSK